MHCFISKVLRLDSFRIIWFIFRRAWSNIGLKRSAPARDHKEGCTGRGKRTTNSTSWNTHARMKSVQNQRSVGFSLSDKIKEQLLNFSFNPNLWNAKIHVFFRLCGSTNWACFCMSKSTTSTRWRSSALVRNVERGLWRHTYSTTTTSTNTTIRSSLAHTAAGSSRQKLFFSGNNFNRQCRTKWIDSVFTNFTLILKMLHCLSHLEFRYTCM